MSRNEWTAPYRAGKRSKPSVEDMVDTGDRIGWIVYWGTTGRPTYFACDTRLYITGRSLSSLRKWSLGRVWNNGGEWCAWLGSGDMPAFSATYVPRFDSEEEAKAYLAAAYLLGD